MYDTVIEAADISRKEDISIILNDMVAYIYRTYVLLDQIQDKRIKFIKTNEMYSVINKVSVYNIATWLKKHDYVRLVYIRCGGSKEIAGIIAGWTDDRVTTLNIIYIRESLRNIGIGFTSLKTIIRELQLGNTVEINVTVPIEYGLTEIDDSVSGLLSSAGFVRVDGGRVLVGIADHSADDATISVPIMKYIL